MHTHRCHTHPDHQHSDQAGALIRWPRRYDLLVSFALAGRGRRLRADIAQQLDLRPGNKVLDVGCGTGTLTLALARVVGPEGWAGGVDASSQMIAAAATKATRKHLPTRFQVATAQDLPFPDGSMDAVVTSLMIHHLPAVDRPQAAAELLRVLRPSGHLLIAEFQAPTRRVSRAIVRHLFGHAMADTDLDAIVDLTVNTGAINVQHLQTRVPWLGLVHARKPPP
jgi:ubiquinone/menaquinone biosynthesis C-methylase UbiE